MGKRIRRGGYNRPFFLKFALGDNTGMFNIIYIYKDGYR